MKKSVFIFLLLLILLTTSCALKHIEDKNGVDDYSLNTLTDNDFVKGYTALSVGSITTTKGNTTNISVKKMSGISNLKTIKPNGKTVTITTNLKLDTGNIRLVLMKQKEIIYDFKINQEDSYTITLSNDTYNLRLGGESAGFSLSYSVN